MAFTYVDTASSSRPARDLERLLLSLFAPQEILRFVRHHFGNELSLSLPPCEPATTFVHELVQRLGREGRVDATLFDLLADERPDRADTIRGVQRAVLPSRATPKPPSRVAWFATASLLLGALVGVGVRRLTPAPAAPPISPPMQATVPATMPATMVSAVSSAAPVATYTLHIEPKRTALLDGPSVLADTVLHQVGRAASTCVVVDDPRGVVCDDGTFTLDQTWKSSNGLRWKVREIDTAWTFTPTPPPGTRLVAGPWSCVATATECVRTDHQPNPPRDRTRFVATGR